MPGRSTIQRLSAVAAAAAGALVVGLVGAPPAFAAVDGSGVVINEVYARGGSANQPYVNKFVELYNPTDADVSLSGWSLQYRSATGTGRRQRRRCAHRRDPGRTATTSSHSAATARRASRSPRPMTRSRCRRVVRPGRSSSRTSPGRSTPASDRSSPTRRSSTSSASEPRTASRARSPPIPARTPRRAASSARTPSTRTTTRRTSSSPSRSPPRPPVPTPRAAHADRGDHRRGAGHGRRQPARRRARHRRGRHHRRPPHRRLQRRDDPDRRRRHHARRLRWRLRRRGTRGRRDRRPRQRHRHGQRDVRAHDDHDHAPPASTVVTAAAGVPGGDRRCPPRIVGTAREAFEGMLVAPSRVLPALEHARGLQLRLAVAHRGRLAAGQEHRAGRRRPRRQRDRRRQPRPPAHPRRRLQHPGRQRRAPERAAVLHGRHDRAQRRPLRTCPRRRTVLSYGFDAWRLQPQTPIDSASDASVKPTFDDAEPAPGDAARRRRRRPGRRASTCFNYFTTLRARTPTPAARTRLRSSRCRRRRSSRRSTALDAEIVALQEIENSLKLGETADEASPTSSPASTRPRAPSMWDYVPTPAALTRRDDRLHHERDHLSSRRRLAPVGDSADRHGRDASGTTPASRSRQVFDIADGTDLTVVANHFKSKSRPPAAPSRPTARASSTPTASPRRPRC